MTNEWKKFIDTNILIYLEDIDDLVKHDVAISVIKNLMDSNNGVISTQILAEFSNQMRKMLSAKEVNNRISDYQESFELITYSTEEIKKANELFEMYKILNSLKIRH